MDWVGIGFNNGSVGPGLDTGGCWVGGMLDAGFWWDAVSGTGVSDPPNQEAHLKCPQNPVHYYSHPRTISRWVNQRYHVGSRQIWCRQFRLFGLGARLVYDDDDDDADNDGGGSKVPNNAPNVNLKS